MKINTHFDTEPGTFIFPDIIMGYNTKDKTFVLLFMFACWAFSIEFCFK